MGRPFYNFSFQKFCKLVSYRSPSPEPVYDSHGKRLNTREVRMRQRLEMQRHNQILEMQKQNPGYKPPPDYK